MDPKLDPKLAQELAERFCPELVLYPEIERGSRRRKQTRCKADDDGPRSRHVSHDYHPRSIDLMLDGRARMSSQRWLVRLFKSFFPGRIKDPEEARAEIAGRTGDDAVQDYVDIFPGTWQAMRKGFWKRYAKVLAEVGEELDRYPVTAYVNVRSGEGLDFSYRVGYEDLLVIQYWFFYIYNDWVNTHEGDWEHVDVVLKKEQRVDQVDWKPIVGACSAHKGGFQLPWELVERVGSDRKPSRSGEHPVIYVAAGSHANYLRGGRRYALVKSDALLTAVPLWARPVDHTRPWEEGGAIRPAVRMAHPVIDPADEPDWLKFKGRWGSRGFAQGWLRHTPVVGRMSEGPPNPSVRPVWDNPFAWIERCDQPAGRRWLAELG